MEAAGIAETSQCMQGCSTVIPSFAFCCFACLITPSPPTTSPHPLNIVTGGGLKPQPYQTQVDILTQPYLSISSWWTRLVPAHLNVDKDAMIGFIQRLACFGLQRHLKGNFRLPWRQAARLGDVQWVLKQLDGLPPETGYNMILATQDPTWYWLHRIQHDDDTGYTGYNMILATQDPTWWWYWLHRIQHDTGYTGYNMMMILATQDTTWYWLHRTHDTGYNIWWYKTDSVFSSYVTLNYSFYCPYFSVSWNAACIHQNWINVCSWQD